MRTFFAIKIPEDIKNSINTEINTLKHYFGHGVKWVNPSQLHLTLKFIADLDPHHIKFINDNLLATMSGSAPFELQINKFGIFPSSKQPRILWYGIQPKHEILRVANLIEIVCSELGYEKEKRSFTPHLTIGRVRKNLSQKEIHDISSSLKNHRSNLSLKFSVSTIYFIKSQLTPQGPIYSDIFSIPL